MSALPYIVGTSGYSFRDWVGTFYPAGTASREMFAHYMQSFSAVELNFTYYRLPSPATLDHLAKASPEGFAFWVKANQETTHKQNRAVAGQFVEGVAPLARAGKLAGVLLQFPQSFHRTLANRKYLAAALDDLSVYPLAVEFRHSSWEAPATLAGLRQRQVSLAVPDVPDLPGLFHSQAAATTPTGYLRLHSREAGKWYSSAERYDYSYSPEQLEEIHRQWQELEGQVERIFVFFNNCHRGQAAANAQAFERIVRGL